LGNLDLHGILENLRRITGPLVKLILAISFICGIGFVFRGLAMLHTFGQLQQQLHKPNGIAGPFIYILVGTALIYMPSTLKVSSATIFGDAFQDLVQATVPGQSGLIQLTGGQDDPNNPGGSTPLKVANNIRFNTNASSDLMAYVSVGIGNEWSQLIDVVVIYIQLVGLIAFIRGWFIMAQAGAPGQQPGSISKGLVHIVGGIVAINFVPFMQAIAGIIF
jgi:intracellular multiplication protein IcmC